MRAVSLTAHPPIVRHRLFNSAAAASALAFGLTLAAGFQSEVDPLRQYVSIGDGSHLSLTSLGGSPALTLFNNLSIGPHPGTIGISSSSRKPKIIDPRITGFSGLPGVYYQRIEWRNGTVIWRLLLSLWYPLLASSTLPLVWVIRGSRRRSPDPLTCHKCGYNLRATPDRCPECGGAAA